MIDQRSLLLGCSSQLRRLQAAGMQARGTRGHVLHAVIANWGHHWLEVCRRGACEANVVASSCQDSPAAIGSLGSAHTTACVANALCS